MKIDNKIYFAPGIEFKSVNWANHQELLNYFEARVHAYYLTPAYRMSELIRDGEPSALLGIAFGSGVIGCTTIDFLARIEFNSNAVTSRYTQWLKKYVPGMANLNPDNQQQTIAYRFFDEFRNGLVHEGRVKNAGQFSLDPEPFLPPSPVYAFIDNAMIVHPFYLLDVIRAGLDQFCVELQADTVKLSNFAIILQATFQADINYSVRT